MTNLQACLLSFATKVAKVSDKVVHPSMSGAASALNKIHTTRLKTLQKAHDALRKHNDQLRLEANEVQKEVTLKQMEYQHKIQEAQSQAQQLSSDAQAAASQAAQPVGQPAPPPSQPPYPGMPQAVMPGQQGAEQLQPQ